MMKNPHAIPVTEVVQKMNVNPHTGLSTIEARKRRATYGMNRLSEDRTKSAWRIAFEQFLDPIIYVLGVAMILAFAFQEWVEGFAVLAVILLTAMIGFFMELQAVRSVEALQKIAQTVSNTLRQGKIKSIKARFLVPGDIILLQSGDVVPADARIIEHRGLATKEAVLTGESNQIEKSNDVIPLNSILAERKNMLFSGTIIARGYGKAIVTAIGSNTEIGEINRLTQKAKKEHSPLEKRLNKLSRWLILFTLVLAIIITISGYFQGRDLFLMVKIGIALAVAAIPEGLPIVATIALARGMVRLSKQKVIIKKLEAVQTLGETTIVCTDKTGTLTEDKMSVHHIILNDNQWTNRDIKTQCDQIKENDAFKYLIRVAVLCNNYNGEDNLSNGDSIENALVDFAKKIDYNPIEIQNKYPRLAEIPFDTDTKIMATLNRFKNNYIVCVKGAIEQVLSSCKYILGNNGIQPIKNKNQWNEDINKFAATGLRLLAFAYRETNIKPIENELVKDLTFVGCIGFLDPPREDVKQAIQTYKNAGIKVVMITGDHPNTARKIAEEVGLLSINNSEASVIRGSELESYEGKDEEQEKAIMNALVFARMVPSQKLDLVEFYQKHNAVVGMIGDGVNDAPALKKADIGIAMGIRGTEAAKEVSDVILMDDKFTSTELAIRQGRTIYENIRHFVVYLLSCNLAEIIAVSIASLSKLPLPLLPLQILFLNLVTDVFPALALGMGKGDARIMEQPPRHPDEPIISKKLWISTFIYGLSITAVVLGVTIYAHFIKSWSYEVVNNMAFYTLVLAQLINVFNMPNRSFSFFKNAVTTNLWVWIAIALSLLIVVIAYYMPILQTVLSLVKITVEQFIIVCVFGMSSLLLIQLIKRLGGTV
ncbi:cation-translocating P-type ATPase [Winogradskyella alexanderae]|uniref:Cation-transporting P-type ATPase n=1 Tax=Winogradskyella alexanderae TaxID=2877123 RepID=A0ABS7XWA2_9FLAO|nr:cation-transporting P-type ATPase [Winogradskyella alexanderae]MCA0133703.1 cation-transporting P-type ATPase [Winogradskyella alexanderae]